MITKIINIAHRRDIFRLWTLLIKSESPNAITAVMPNTFRNVNNANALRMGKI